MISLKSPPGCHGVRNQAGLRARKGREMICSRFAFCGAASALLVSGLCLTPAQAQLYQVVPPRSFRTTPAPAPYGSQSMKGASNADTRITIEIFTGKEGVGFAAQEWETVFERAGLLARIHPAFPGDKISIREKRLGKLREVFLVGRLERNGMLVFPGRKFARSESAGFEEWLRELQTYGAQGSPTGKRSGGSAASSFRRFPMSWPHRSSRKSPISLLTRQSVGCNFPRNTPSGCRSRRNRLSTAPGIKQRRGRLQLRGFSRGTALAMLLAQVRLGFHPNRTPSGKLELVAVPVDDQQQVWPIGWDTPEGAYPASIAPNLFKQTQVELKDQKLIDVLEAIADKTGTPVRIDFASVAARGLDLDSVLVSASGEHMTWSRLLSTITSPSFLTAQIRTDEAKRPFVWVTSIKNAPMRHSRPPASKRATRPASAVRPSESSADQ